MLCFLGKTILSQAHRQITTISRTSLQLVSVSVQNKNSWVSVKYMSKTSNVQQRFAVSYLINTCGFSPEEAASASKYLNFQTREKPDLIIEFFKKQGFSQTQVLCLIKGLPALLRYNPEKCFMPKIEYFKSKGVLCSDIPKIIASSPHILSRSLQKQIIPSFDFFMSLFQSEDKFVKALKRFSGILLNLNTHAVPNIKVLREVGVPEWNIIKLLEWQPRALTKKHDRFKEIVGEAKEMGLDPLTTRFFFAVGTKACLSKFTWTRKADLYKRWGWSDDEILAAFRSFPQCMTLSEDKVEKTMDFFVNQMGCESSTIARNPVLLGMSFNKRIVPRASVIQVLLSKGLVKQLAFSQMFYSSEEVFLDKFIMCHGNEADELLKLYQAKMDVEPKKLIVAPAFTRKPDQFKEIVGEVKEMGLDPLRKTFVLAVRTMTCISKSIWTRKADLYKRWGWSDDDIFAAFGRYPYGMAISEDKIEVIIDFFVNEMGCESSTNARYPVLLGYSFNKRIFPRASVFQVLLSNGLVEKLSLWQIFYSSESFFLEKFIMRHKNEANELLKL